MPPPMITMFLRSSEAIMTFADVGLDVENVVENKLRRVNARDARVLLRYVKDERKESGAFYSLDGMAGRLPPSRAYMYVLKLSKAQLATSLLVYQFENDQVGFFECKSAL